jgi:hypothetical protein
MTDHTITPPPELVSKWCHEDGEEIKSSPRWFFSVCAKAAQWGADQELDACCEYVYERLKLTTIAHIAQDLHAVRRPKPPSLKEQALYELDELFAAVKQLGVFNPPKIIRQALESLPE